MLVYIVRSFPKILALALLTACEAENSADAAAAAPAFATTRERFSGVVTETLVAGTYRYFSLRLADGEQRWVVLADRRAGGADRLSVDCHGRSDGFASPRLGRTFSPLYFCSQGPSPTPGDRP